MKIARNCENSHLPRSFWKWGWGRVSSRRVDRCRARLLLSGTKVAFIGAKDRETTHLPRTGVFGYGTGWGCRLVGKLSGKKSSFVGNDFVWAVTRKRLLPMCLENAFPVIHFSKFSGGGPVQWASRLTALAGGKFCRESMPVPPNQFHPVRLYLHVA